MTTLVTGATGFIGGNLARLLSARGEAVRALVRPAANDLAIRDTGVGQVPGDLLDIASLRRAAAGCDRIYHCAATYSFWSRRPGDIYRTNVAGTVNLLNVAREAGVRRVVFTSSVATIGLPGADAACYDLGYGGEAGFLRWARAAGCARAHDGLGMLIEQAAESFALWHGVRPDAAAARLLLRP